MELNDSMDKTNYRQAGKGLHGRVVKGFINDPLQKETSSSIPYKFETVLYQNNNPRGFGSAGTRFVNSDDLAPGPGSYDCNTSFTSEASTSYSKKGYGVGFVSRTSRLSTPVYINTGPGPGQYLIKDKKRPFPHVPPAGIGFMRSQSTEPKTRDASFDMPGPGHYDPNLSYVSNTYHTKDISSAFKALGKAENIIKTDAPPPGAYDIDRSISQKKPYIGPEASPYFMQPAKKLLSEEQAKKNLVNQLLDKEEGNSLGPGSYFPDKKEDEMTLFNQKIHNKPHANFVVNNLTRFGEIVNKKAKKTNLPGPGAYARIILDPEKQLVSGSVFMSEVPRRPFSIHKTSYNVGPSKYHPEMVNKKSYHLNLNKAWV